MIVISRLVDDLAETVDRLRGRGPAGRAGSLRGGAASEIVRNETRR